MNNILSSDEIEKVCQILHSNQNKINLLRNDISNNSDIRNNKLKTNQFLNGLEIDIKNILSLLERIKINYNNKNQNQNQNGNYKTYCINDDKNMLQDIVICGCCECCRCNKCCNCSTNNCSEIQQLNISNNNQNPNDNELIKENINDEDNKNNQFLNNKTFSQSPYFNNKSFSPYSNMNHTYPNLNTDNSNNITTDFNKNNHSNFIGNKNDFNKCLNNNNNNNDFNNCLNNQNNNDFNNLLNPNKEQNLGFNNNNNNNNEGKIIYSPFKSFSPSKMNNYENAFRKTLGYIKQNNYNNNNNNNLDNEDGNLQIEDIIKNSAIIKSKRFHPSKSFDNMDIQPSQRITKGKIISINKNRNNINDIFNNNNNNNNNLFNVNDNNSYGNNNRFNIRNNDILNDNINKYDDNYNRNNKMYIDDNNNKNDNLGQKKKKMEKMNKIQNFLNKLYKQPEEVTNRFKKIYGDDIEERLLNGNIDNDNLMEMDNILNKIINMSIWGDDDKIKKRSRDSHSLDKSDIKRKHRFIYNPIQEKIKLMKSIKNKQAFYREFPRGWYSTKEYFINNGTDINNENINKYV